MNLIKSNVNSALVDLGIYNFDLAIDQNDLESFEPTYDVLLDEANSLLSGKSNQYGGSRKRKSRRKLRKLTSSKRRTKK